MGLGEMLKIIYNLIKWEIWAIMQIFHIGKWLYGLVQSYRPPPAPKPFSISPDAWHSHAHIVAGSGHGKTQLLQMLLSEQIDKLSQGASSIIVIDSQGDMIQKILHMSEMNHLDRRLIYIDPTDIENPPALNLFDFGLDRLEKYSPLEQERLINGAIFLYEYLFGALLGSELTQKQNVVFRFLAQLLMVVPGATIHTLREFVKTPEAVRPHLHKLDETARDFFETEFFSSMYDNTRNQIAYRLWAVLSMRGFARMFTSPHNKIDLFTAMNSGSIILINTAKEHLKPEACSIFGRFFIALISMATQERSIISEYRRLSTLVFIDEASDYFDDGGAMQNLFEQGRKYKVGCVIAHQQLDQLSPDLRSTVTSNTAIKIVGGLSDKDANFFAREMRCTPDELHMMIKQDKSTDFACLVKNQMEKPIRLTVMFGEIERRAKLSPQKYEALIQQNRELYGAKVAAIKKLVPEPPREPNLDPEDPLLL